MFRSISLIKARREAFKFPVGSLITHIAIPAIIFCLMYASASMGNPLFSF